MCACALCDRTLLCTSGYAAAAVGRPTRAALCPLKIKKDHPPVVHDISIKDTVKDTPVDNVLYERERETGQWSEP